MFRQNRSLLSCKQPCAPTFKLLGETILTVLSPAQRWLCPDQQFLFPLGSSLNFVRRTHLYFAEFLQWCFIPLIHQWSGQLPSWGRDPPLHPALLRIQRGVTCCQLGQIFDKDLYSGFNLSTRSSVRVPRPSPTFLNSNSVAPVLRHCLLTDLLTSSEAETLFTPVAKRVLGPRRGSYLTRCLLCTDGRFLKAHTFINLMLTLWRHYLIKRLSTLSIFSFKDTRVDHIF